MWGLWYSRTVKSITYSEKEHEITVYSAVTALAEGVPIVYPTDTVYGLGADATSTEAVVLVKLVKEREGSKPILALVSDVEMMSEYAHVTPLARALAEEFLPGPLTLVLQIKNEQLKPIASLDGSVGFRIPDHSFCLDLVSRFGRPITSTSVNRAGKSQPRLLKEMLEQLGDNTKHVHLVVDAGELPTHLQVLLPVAQVQLDDSSVEAVLALRVLRLRRHHRIHHPHLLRP